MGELVTYRKYRFHDLIAEEKKSYRPLLVTVGSTEPLTLGKIDIRQV